MYCQQLGRLAVKIEEQRPQHYTVRFLHDNARPHTARMTRMKLLELGWELLPHLPYSPDLAPSDFHLFRSLSNPIDAMKFDDTAQLFAWIENFFASKGQQFYSYGIMKLPDKLRNVS